MTERFAHPEVTMHTFPLSEYMRYVEAGEWEGVASLMLASALKVAGAGADFVICPDNTIHQAFDLAVEKSPIPWLHIAGEVAAEAKRQNYRRVGVLGTRFLMGSPVYADKLADVDIEYVIPDTEDRERINDAIFAELIPGLLLPKTRSFFRETIKQFKKEDCDAVVLGCTEIPLLITQEDSPLPILDSTRILARAALKKAIVTA